MNDIDDQIRAYYGRQMLSPDARTLLNAIVRDGLARRNRDRWHQLKTGVAAAFLVMVTASVLWLSDSRRPASEAPLQIAGALAHHAALGHNGRQQLEFRASTTSELTSRMKSVDFNFVEPDMIRKTNMRIVGARYTTLEGTLAAQVAYVDSKGEACTLYEMRAVARLAQVPAVDLQLDGTRVSIWHEKGLLMILARPLA